MTTAKQFKQEAMTKAHKVRAVRAVQVRTNVNAKGSEATAGDRKALRTSWTKREMRPGNYHVPNGKPVLADKNNAPSGVGVWK